jgi:hypothetical protein
MISLRRKAKICWINNYVTKLEYNIRISELDNDIKFLKKNHFRYSLKIFLFLKFKMFNITFILISLSLFHSLSLSLSLSLSIYISLSPLSLSTSLFQCLIISWLHIISFASFRHLPAVNFINNYARVFCTKFWRQSRNVTRKAA